MKLKTTLAIIAAVALTFSCKGPQNAAENQETLTEDTLAMAEITKVPDNIWANLGEEPLLKLSTSDGDMVIKLYSDTPLHRDNFIKLVRQGYYNGILFHRIIDGFMIQTGDPYSKDSTKIALVGTGGPGYTIPAEIVNTHHHKKGALAAARLGDRSNPERKSSGSQFYIVQSETGCSHLDGEYTIFGEVIEGLEVIDKISSEPTDQRDRPLNRVEIISVLPVVDSATTSE